ncbi:M14 family metallopeptidase [Clostridium faecium]|uniref:Succinylglutamate desuccinylase/aspartoacylase family protein n=1 Tax=Clostridium faecium TaxID=2762223 RepID=A0ABR8YUD6_9CLOT|nr:M14 family metallopeptidase [Clostridium faecium]MBD8047561.1 succinylglutamate desuccinylase/aspartoacylase family protein [Clostridium faecium]
MRTYKVEELFNEYDITKKQGFLEVAHTEIRLPFTLISGKQKGKTILITAGVHGAEYVGIETSKNLSRIIEPKDVTGRIIIIHTVNCSGFRERLSAVTAEDGENLNRIFPGDERGNISQRLAHFILTSLSKKVDFYIDMHGADLHGNIRPLVFYPVAVDKEVSKIAKEAAQASGFPYLVASTAKNGSYSRAALEGTPSILTELGGMGIWSKEEVDSYTDKILNVLDYLQIHRTNSSEDMDITYFEPVNEILSKEEGFWYPFFKTGDGIKKGEKIGEIKDVFDNLLGEYHSPTDGIVLYQTVALSVKAEGFLSAISAIEKV